MTSLVLRKDKLTERLEAYPEVVYELKLMIQRKRRQIADAVSRHTAVHAAVRRSE